MNEKIKDQTDYIVAFLAAIIGLSFFKTELSEQNVKILSSYPTLLNLSIFVVSMLLLASYFGALARLANSFNITKVPLQGILSSLTSVLSAIGLLSPLFLLFAYGLTFIPIPSVQSIQATIFGGTLGVIAGLTIGLSRIKNERRQIAKRATNIIYPDDTAETISSLSSPKPEVRLNKMQGMQQHFVVNSYKSLEKFIANYLYIRGYGVQSEDLVQLVSILHDKGVVTDDDLQQARQVADLRNLYTHGQSNASQKELSQAQQNILELYKKVQKAYLSYLGSGAGSNYKSH